MSDDDPPAPAACCESGAVCVFAKALLARTAVCGMACRRSVGEREVIECSSPVARTNCGTLAALMHERARFALRLPSPGLPVIHALALRLHCGGLIALQQALGATQSDVHAMIGTVHERYASMTELPWDSIVRDLVAWRPRARRRADPP